MPNLKHLQWGNETYDFDASAFMGKTYEQVTTEIKNAVDTAQFIVPTTAAETPDITFFYDVKAGTITKGGLTPGNADRNNIYLVLKNDSPAYYEEYIVTVKDGILSWIKFGNTNVNLQDYIKKGTERTTIDNGGFTVTPTVSVTYDKADNYTGKGFGDTTKSTSAVAPTGTATFSGSITTFSPTATLDNYNPTLTVTKATEPITFVTGMKTEGGGYHNHKVSTHSHETKNVVTGLSFSSASLTSNTSSVVESVNPTTKGFLQGSIKYENNEYILVLAEENAVTYVNAVPTTVISSISYTPVNATFSTVDVAGVSSATTITTSSADAHTHTLYNTVLEPVMDVSINPGKPSITISSITYTPEGSVSITMDTHSHDYIAPAAHQHSISSTPTTATGSTTITIGPHSHKVTL